MKKFFKVFILSIIGLSVIIIGMAYLFSDIKISNKINVNVKADHAFVIMVDESTMKQWFPQVKKISVVKGLPLQPGSLNELVLEVEGEKIIVLVTIDEFKAFEKLNISFYNHIFSGTANIVFKDINNHSEVLVTATISGETLYAKVGMLFLQSQMEAMANKIAERFKSIAEL